MSMDTLYRDMLVAAEGRVRELMCDKALLLMQLRIAELTVEALNAKACATAIRSTLDMMEKLDVQRLAALDECVKAERAHAHSTGEPGPAAPAGCPQAPADSRVPQGGTIADFLFGKKS